MRSLRILPPLFAAAALVLLAANAMPTTLRKRILLEERARLQTRLEEERSRAGLLESEIRAIRDDPFVLQRWACETWGQEPGGTLPWPPPDPPASPEIAPEEMTLLE